MGRDYLMADYDKASNDPNSGRVFQVGDQIFQRAARPYLMGIINVTPDSFSDGGRFIDVDDAVEYGLKMADEGADFIDVGGESSRPGAEGVPLEEEIKRVIPIIEDLSGKVDIPISIDTVKAKVAEKALEAGAQIINDITAMRHDEDMAKVVASAGATVILMHMKGEPRSMQDDPHYDDMMGEISHFLKERVEVAVAAGVSRDRILIDPGIGFGKRLEDNLEILGRLREFTNIAPVLIGPSRKSFIGKILDVPVDKRIFGTAASVAVATMNGADVIRVHDVKEMIEVAEIASRCMMSKAEITS